MRSYSKESDDDVEMLMSLKRCTRNVPDDFKVIFCMVFCGGDSSGWDSKDDLQELLRDGVWSLLCHLLRVACFFRRGGGIGVAVLEGESKLMFLLLISVSGMLGSGCAALDSWRLVRWLLMEGGGGLGGGDLVFSMPFSSWVLLLSLFKLPPESWLCTFKKRGFMKHRAPLVWLHSNSEGVLVRRECTPFIRGRWWDSLLT